MSDPNSVPQIPSRSSSPARRWILRLAAILAAAVLLLVLAAPLLVNSMVRPKVVAALNEQLTGEVRIEALHFSWTSGLLVEGLRIANPPGFAPGEAASIGRITAHPSILSLLGGKLVLKEPMRVEKVRLQAVQNEKGDLNLAKLVKEGPVKKAKPNPATPKADRPQAAGPGLDAVRGSVVLDDLVVSLKTPALAAPAALAPLHVETRLDADQPISFTVTNADRSLVAKGDLQAGARPTARLDYAVEPGFLAPLVPALATLGGVKKFEGSLSGKGQLAFGAPQSTSGQGDLTFSIGALELELADGQGRPVLHRLEPGDTKLAYEIRPADGKAQVTLSVRAPATSFDIKGVTDGTGFDGAVELAADLSELGRRLPGVVPADAKLQGRVSANVPRLKADAVGLTAELLVRGENLSSHGTPPVKAIETRLRLGANFPKQEYALESSLDLAGLREAGVALGALVPATELSGGLRLVAEIRRPDAVTAFQVTAEGSKVHFKGPQTGGVAIDEPAPSLKVVGSFAQEGAGSVITLAEGSALAAQLARGTVKGKLKQDSAGGWIGDHLAIDLAYDPDKLNPLLAALDAGRITAKGPQQVQVRIDGPLQPGESVPRWLNVVRTGGRFAFGGYQSGALTVEGGPLDLNHADGLIPIDYACRINGGTFSAKGMLRPAGSGSDFSVKLEGMDINGRMSSWLGMFNPLMGGGKSQAPQLSGQVHAQLAGSWKGAMVEETKPGAAPRDPAALAADRLSGKGRFSVSDFKASGSPLLVALNSLAGGSGEKIGEIQPTDFSIGSGELRYDSMVVMLSGQKFVFSGSVHFDQRIEMQITMPFPSKLLKDQRLAKYVTTVTVPLTGTVAEPKLDSQAVIQLALKNAANAALKDGIGGALDKATGGGAGNLLKGLFGDKKK